MPELPEMEIYKVLLQQLIGRQTITGVTINREKSINETVDQFALHVANQKITAIDRRAKYLIFRLQNGTSLLLHLMLGGRMFYGRDEDKPNRTVQVQLSFGDNNLYFIGLRLGYLHHVTPEMLNEEFKDIGPEPIDANFSLDDFLAIMNGRRGGVKTTLLKQKVIAGIGNRYSDEILWHAQILPERKVHELEHEELERLFGSIKYILQQGIQQGGYMEAPLFKGDAKTGGYKMQVHDREGYNCPRCSTPIVKVEISSRKTYFCPNCQH